MAMSRSEGSTSFTTCPPMATVPLVTVSSPAIMRSRVDLPQPDGPTSTQKCPSGTSKVTPFTASTLPAYTLRTASSLTSAILLLRLDQAAHEQPLHRDHDEHRR